MAFFSRSREDREAERIRKQIDKQLKKEKAQKDSTVKILITGGSQSGKSTIVKQMRIIHGQGYSERDRLEYRSYIYQKILIAFKIIIDARLQLQIPLEDLKNEYYTKLVLNYQGHLLSDEDFQEYMEALSALHKDAGIQATIKRRNEIGLVSPLIIVADLLPIG